MTLREFRRSCCGSVSDLMSFAYDHELYDLNEDICDDEYKDEQINDWLSQTGDSWLEVRDVLNDIPTGYEWYWVYGWTEYEGIWNTDPDDIRRLRELIESAMDGYWDEEDEDEDEYDETAELSVEDVCYMIDEDATAAIEEFHFEEVFESCRNKLKSIDDSEKSGQEMHCLI